MSQIHINNVFFEAELSSKAPRIAKKSLKEWFYSHPMYLQLQFLPLLYADRNDRILVTDLPENSDPRLFTYDNDFNGEISCWGASLALQHFLQKKEIFYSMPNFSLVEKIQSKAFSWEMGRKLPGSSLLYNQAQVEQFLKFTGKKVLKSLYGSSGRGHFFPDRGKDLFKFLKTQFDLNLPVIGEPWMSRVLDFSTQWNISKTSIECLGCTQVENSAFGSYLATKVGFDFKEYTWALNEHVEYVKPVLQNLQEEGFFGNIGVDAFVYEIDGKQYLHPLGEINARKTMSYVALMMQKRMYPKKKMKFSFSKNEKGLLPQKLLVLGKEIIFSHNVQVKFEI